MKKIGKLLIAFTLLAIIVSCTNPFIKVKEVLANGDSPTLGDSVSYCKVSYYIGSDYLYQMQSYLSGKVINFPTEPEKDNYTFAGWYKESTFETKVINQVTVVDKDLSLYAKFTDSSQKYTVKILNDDGTTVIASHTDKSSGASITLPTETPTSKVDLTKTFTGWYLNAVGTGSPISGSYTVSSSDANSSYVISIYACYSSSSVPVTAIQITPSTVETLSVGSSVNLSVSYTPTNATTGKSVTWASSNSAVASVSTSGTVTAKKAGSATISATSTGNYTSSVNVTVSETYSISLDKTSVAVNLSDTATQLTATVSPSGTEIEWSSSDTTVASVSSNGLVSYNKAGTAIITAKIKNRTESATCTFTVNSDSKKPTSLSVTSSKSTIMVGSNATLTTIATYNDGTSSVVSSSVYTLSNSSVASVSNSVISAVAKGNLILTSTYTENGATVTATVNIKIVNQCIIVHVPTEINYSYIYAWTGDGKSAVKLAGVWPGTAMGTDSDGWYTYTLEETTAKIIFNKNSGSSVIGTDRTQDMCIPSSGEYWYIGGASGTLDTTGSYVSSNFTTTNPNVVVPVLSVTPTSSIKPDGSIIITCTSDTALLSANVQIKVNGSVKKTLTATQLSDGAETVTGSSLGLADGDLIVITGTATNASGSSETLNISLSVRDSSDVKIYVSADSAPTIWVWQASGLACSDKMGYTWDTQPALVASTDMNDNTNWYVFTIPEGDYTAGENFTFKLNKGEECNSERSNTFWYDLKGVIEGGSAKSYYDTDPTIPPAPVAPSVTFSPVTGSNVALSRNIIVSVDDGNSTITSVAVSVDGTTDKTYTYSNFTNDKLVIPVSDIESESYKTFTISVVVKTSDFTSGTSAQASYTSAAQVIEDPFTWDNALVYFVLTDRFYNGEIRNDGSYYRTSGNSSNTEDVAKFHGGDIKGLTAKLDYFDDLGVNAIWITAPYEQAHGWVGGKNNAFPHYAFHGYYTLDWTYMDQNMGTIEEFRTFVNEAHKKGIRVVMDVVMNHVGYNNTEDMITYSYGKTDHTTHGWFATTNGVWNANDSIDWTNSYWDSTWFGPWIRSFGYDSGSEYGGSCGGLPDVKTELTSSVGMAPVLTTKWGQESDSTVISSSTGNTLGNKYGDYKLPSVSSVDWYGKSGNWRTDKGVAPADYQVIWLSAWVREFGIDGFRCDTAKHVEPYRWGQLKVACQSALEAWRADSSKSAGSSDAKSWDESFWMTGECFGWNAINGSSDDYYGTGKFDSMINFSFNPNQGSGTSSSYPSTSDWSNYLSINRNSDSDGNGNRNNVLTYVSSHDTKLCRPFNQIELGTMLCLLPGGVQIYYGDESSRPLAYTSCGDTDMMTRGDINFGSNTSSVTHWGKIGNFRKYNPAVGAGTGTAYKRTYSGSAGENSIAISLSGTTVDVSGLISNGTIVYNWYDGASATVSNGSVTFNNYTASASKPILVSEKNPADY